MTPWTYDVAGNRATQSGGTGSSGSSVSYAYGNRDASGKVVSQPDVLTKVSSGAGAGSWSYDKTGDAVTRPGWDGLGRLSSSMSTRSGVSTSWFYDADGNRVLGKASDGTVTGYFDSTQLVAAPGRAVSATRQLSFGGELVAQSTGVASAVRGSLAAVVTDRSGSLVASVGLLSGVVSRVWADPFGNRLATTGTPPVGVGFVGRLSSTDGTDHLGAREYDPVALRGRQHRA